jgi:hypothetical protein
LTAAVLATLLGCEIAARVAIDLRGNLSPADERRALVARIPVRETARERSDDDASAVERVSGAAFVLHPFFGYTFRPSFDGADERGFYSGPGPLPHPVASDELVVGVFGGSVAMQIADPRAQLAESLLPAARAAGWSRVTVRSYAIGGWRQPQHFAALVRHLDEIDVAIMLDGFNEVIHLGDWQLSRFPAEHPWSAVYAMLARQPTADETLERAELIRLHRRAERLTQLFALPVVRSSRLAHLAWRVLVARYEASVAELRRTLADGTSFDAFAPKSNAATAAARRDDYFHFWHELIAFSDAITRLRDKPLFHFVQPNQYDRGSKPLSAEERERFTRNVTWFDEVTPRYARAGEMTEQLRAAGVDSTDLGDLFATTPETLYVDDCCHLNELGMRRLAAAIAEHVESSRRLGRRSPSTPPHAAHRGA